MQKIKETLNLRKDIGPGTVKEFKKVWSASCVGFMHLLQWKVSNKKSEHIYPSYSCGKCDIQWCTAAHMYCEEISRDYPAWLVKKMDPGVNKLLNKGIQ